MREICLSNRIVAKSGYPQNIKKLIANTGNSNQGILIRQYTCTTSNGRITNRCTDSQWLARTTDQILEIS